MNAIQYTAPTQEPITIDELMLHLRIDDETAIENDLLDTILTASREHVEDITHRAIMFQVWDYFLQGWPSCDYIKLPFGNLQSVLSLTIADSACVEADGTYDLVFTGTSISSAIGTYTIGTNVITAVSLISGGAGYTTAPTVATQSGDGSVTAALASVKWKDEDGTETTLTAGTDYLIECNGDQCGKIVLPYAESWPSDTLYPSNPIVIRYRCGWNTRAAVPSKIKAAIKMFCADLYANRESQSVMTTQNFIENKTAMRLLQNARLWDEF